MSKTEEPEVEINGASVNVSGDKGEKVRISPGGIHVVDGDSEVKINWGGIKVRDGKTSLNITVWKPLLGCAAGILVFAALLTLVIVGIAKLIIG